MARPGGRVVVPWEDRYHEPTPGELLSGFSKAVLPLVEAAREACLETEDVHERVVWHGVAWKWTLDYRSAAEPDRGWVYLVPRPVRPLIAVPFPQDLMGALFTQRLSRVVRESLMNAPVVGDTCWPQWELLTKTALGEAMSIARQSLAAVRQPV